MSRIFAAMHSFEIQARVSNDALRECGENGLGHDIQRTLSANSSPAFETDRPHRLSHHRTQHADAAVPERSERRGSPRRGTFSEYKGFLEEMRK